jgi:hypothetical protein
VFALTWHCHGGSGLSMTFDDVMSLTPRQRDWFLRRTEQQRRLEADAIAKAHRR